MVLKKILFSLLFLFVFAISNNYAVTKPSLETEIGIQKEHKIGFFKSKKIKKARIKKKVDKTCLWAFIFAVTSPFLIFTAIPAFILGFMGLKKLKLNPDLRGRGFAISAIIIGLGVLAILATIAGISVIHYVMGGG